MSRLVPAQTRREHSCFLADSMCLHGICIDLHPVHVQSVVDVLGLFPVVCDLNSHPPCLKQYVASPYTSLDADISCTMSLKCSHSSAITTPKHCVCQFLILSDMYFKVR